MQPAHSARLSPGSSQRAACTVWPAYSRLSQSASRTAGVYAYAKAGFGDYPGFLSALGYWIGSCIGNVSYWVLIKSTLGAFFPVFGDGNTVIAIVVASIGIWLFHFMILRGVQQAAFINTVVTVAKIVPILVFIVLLFVAFKLDLFRTNFWGGTGMPDKGLFDQVRATMLVTVFVFLGIEGASVYSRYAMKRSDVGTATIMGFLGVTTLMVLVTLLPYAVLQRADIAGMRQPSMASVLEAVVGHWGAIFVSIGLLISVLGAYLAWSLICAEVLSAAGRTKDMPKVFATENENKVPAAGPLVDQHRCSALRDQHLLVDRRIHADAQPDKRDGINSILSGCSLRSFDELARRDLSDTTRRTHTRYELRRHRGDVHLVPYLRCRNEVHPAVCDSI
jgi:amino acid transporter